MDDEFNQGAVFGVILAVIIFLIFWHLGESACQKEHNVYDCKIGGPLMEPVVKEQTNDQ